MYAAFRINMLKIAAFMAFAAAPGQSRQGEEPSTEMHGKEVVCYWGTWSNYRTEDGKFGVHNLDPHLCTHIVYAFAGLKDDKIKSLDPWLDLGDDTPGSGLQNFKKTIALKETNPKLKVTIAIGGWNQESINYSNMAKDAESRSIFVQSVLKMLEEFGFDGLDLDWEYPGQRGGSADDKENFVLLLRDLKEAFKPHGYILTAAIGAAPKTIDISYDIPQLYKYLDLVHVMCYDYHGAWDMKTGHNAPLYAKPNAEGNDLLFTIENSWKKLKEAGAIADKTVMGVPFYGRTYLLANPNDHGIGAKTVGSGFQGPYTQTAGFMGYNEICEELTGPDGDKWTVVRDDDIKAPYMYNGNKWACYDDEESIYEKVNFAMKQGMGGIMLWSVETEDFRGNCGDKYPLLKAINLAMAGKKRESKAPSKAPSMAITAMLFVLHQLH